MTGVAAPVQSARTSSLRTQLAIVTLTVFFSSLAFDLYNGTLPVYLFRERGFSLNLVSLLVGLASVTQLVGALAAGPFIDTRGARLSLRLGPALQVPAALLLVLSRDPVLIGLARVFQATGFVLVLPAAYSLLPGMVSLRRRATALGVVGMGNTLALALGSPLGLWLLARSPYLLFASSATAGVVALAFGSLLSVGARLEHRSQPLGVRAAWLPFLLASLLGFINWGLLLALLPLQLPAAKVSDIGWFFAADAIALTVLRIPFGYAGDRWGGRRMAMVGIVINLAALAVLMQSRSLAALVVAGFGTGAAAALLLPAIQLELSLRSTEEERGTAMALSSAAFALAVTLGTFFGAVVVNGVGFDSALKLAAAACALGLAPLLLGRRVPAAETERLPRPAEPLARFAGLTPVEARIAAVWTEVLGLESLGADELFLDLGGESLHAIQVASRLSDIFDVEVPLVHLFEHPTVSESAIAIEALLATPAHPMAAHLTALSAGPEAPVSFAQERMWFLEQMDPGNAAYNVPYALRFRGELVPTALESSLNRLLTRQDALRTRFETSGGDVLQVVVPPTGHHLRETDLRGGAPEDRDRALGRLLEEDAARPFDLAHGPLYRSRLIRIADDEHVLMLCFHHSVCDEWSRRVLVSELAAGYGDAVSGGGGGAADPLPVRYRDFATWQRRGLLGERERELLDFWAGELVDAPLSLGLVTDRSRPAERTYRGATIRTRLGAGTARSVHELSRRHRVTPFMTMLSVFATMLQRYTGEDDLLIGSPVANRNTPETEQIIGCFVNTLVLRMRMAGDPTFEELLSQSRSACLRAYGHSEMPFERLVSHLDPDRNMSRTPVFQVMFDMESPPPVGGFPAGLEVEPVNVTTTTAMFDLSLTITESADGMVASFEYSTDLFEAATIARMAEHFEQLLESVLATPGQRLADLEMLTPAERERLRELVPGPAVAAGPLVISRVEEHARRRPDAVAVEAAGQEVTYSGLNASANRLARHLVSLGVKLGDMVGICLERSPDFVVAVLAAHKVGAAYSPLDPAYPPARLGALLDDMRPALTLTDSRFLDRLGGRDTRTLCLDLASAEVSVEDSHDLGRPPDPDRAAYVIHTSGSTGRPKGVVVSQGALANWASASLRAYGLGHGDRVLQFHSIGFDASVGDIFSTLAAGATLVIAPDPVRLSPAALLDALAHLRPTVADLPTAYWHELVGELEGRPALPVELRLVVIGGESALPEVVRRWQRLADPGIRLANSYGPTECTVVATVWWLGAGFSDREFPRVPIGRPVENVRAFVLDSRMRPCPIGVPGELHLGGAQLATGYLNLAEETERRFVAADPFGSGLSERLYKTGDRARRLLDGSLEFLGRVDRQVKVRGVRIELGEVEAALASHPAVAEVVVEAQQRAHGDTQLAAYFTLRPHLEATPADMRRHLELRLPSQAVPASYVALDRLPRNSSGKLDRSALAAAAPARAVPVSRVRDEPITPLERTLAQTWASVLDVEAVGREENFFELGGHSLMAARLVGRLRRDLAVELPVRVLFEAPTIAAMARRIEAVQREASSGRQPLEQR